MSSKRAIAWGCGILAFLALAGVAAIAVFIGYASQGVKGIGVAVDGPGDVVVGQTFGLTVTVTNQRPRKVLALSDIDIAEAYLAGFTIAGVEPKQKSSMHVPIDNSRSFTFDVKIPPHASKTFTFTLQAKSPGVYRGDVDVCEGMRIVTGMAQTAVKEKP
jgi:hypothetical protein